MALRSVLLCTALLWATALQAAQTVYRCGPGGREYSHMPCKEGRAVEVDDTRSPTQQREAQGVAASQRRLARQLETERRQREATAVPLGAAGIKPVPGTAAAASAPQKSKRKSKQTVAAAEDQPVPARVPAPAKAPAR